MRRGPGFFGVAATVSLVLLAGLVFTLIPKKSKTIGSGKPLILYCAAGMKLPVDDAVKAYQNEYGQAVQVQYGGSGTLLSNMRVSRTGDLFLAADMDYLDRARELDLIDEAFPLAALRPVIAVAKGNPKNVRHYSDLSRPTLKVSLANPDAAAVGRIGKDILMGLGVWKSLEKNAAVFKPTVGDVANDIRLGAVDAGIVWDATANQYPDLESITVPEFDSHDQHVVVGICRSSTQPQAAIRFARYLSASDRGLRSFKDRGFSPIKGDPWDESPELLLYSGGVNRIAVEETILNFEARHGVRVTRVYNGCGILVSQINTGQVPDAYFACDISFMEQVRDKFDSATTVAQTDVVILTQKGNPHAIGSLHDLSREGLMLGVANPRQSALGELTQKLLRKSGILESVMKNVRSQTPTADLLVNQIRTGSLDAAIVYAANVSQVKQSLEIVPVNLPGSIAIQPFASGKKSAHRQLAGQLLAAITSADSRSRFEQAGFRWRVAK